jgi:hypothetical protein
MSILFDASDVKSARATIRKAEVRYPLEGTELHFANFNASLLTELEKKDLNKEFMRVLGAATVELGGRLTGRLDARCMTALLITASPDLIGRSEATTFSRMQIQQFSWRTLFDRSQRMVNGGRFNGRTG